MTIANLTGSWSFRRAWTLLVLLLLAAPAARAQQPGFAVQLGGNQNETINDVAIDARGNLYLTGRFQVAATLSQSPQPLSSGSQFGAYGNGFVAKYSAGHQLQWVRVFTTSGWSAGRAVAVDRRGRCYVAGGFAGATLELGPTRLISHDTSATHAGDVFVTCLDSAGQYLWATSGGGLMPDTPFDILPDDAGHCYVTGMFNLKATFEQVTFYGFYSGVANGHQDPAFSLPSASIGDLFLLKYDSLGHPLWGRCVINESIAWGIRLALDPSGDVLTQGMVSSLDLTTETGDSIHVAPTTAQNLLLRYSPGGVLRWAKLNGPGLNIQAAVGLTSNSAGTWQYVHFLRGQQLLADGSVLTGDSGRYTGALVRLDSAGNWLSALPMRAPRIILTQRLVTDAAGNLYGIGYFKDTLTTGTLRLVGHGEDDGYLIAYSPQGVPLWGDVLGGNSYDDAGSGAGGRRGEVLVAGTFMTTMPLPASAGGPLTAVANSDAFAVLYPGPTLAGVAPSPAQPLGAWPNPAQGELRFRVPAGAVGSALLLGALGREVRRGAAGEARLSLVGVAPGVYALVIPLTSGRRLTQRVVITAP
ncbi:MAG: hypothetical protein H7330_03080 [Hymenobacteraceae bacterium]|nr:hypothetical protein [Hymenobacteraceae bacterium]